MTFPEATNHPAIPTIGMVWGMANMAVAEAAHAPAWLGLMSALGPIAIGVGACLSGYAAVLKARKLDPPEKPRPPYSRWKPPYDG